MPRPGGHKRLSLETTRDTHTRAPARTELEGEEVSRPGTHPDGSNDAPQHLVESGAAPPRRSRKPASPQLRVAASGCGWRARHSTELPGQTRPVHHPSARRPRSSRTSRSLRQHRPDLRDQFLVAQRRLRTALARLLRTSRCRAQRVHARTRHAPSRAQQLQRIVPRECTRCAHLGSCTPRGSVRPWCRGSLPLMYWRSYSDTLRPGGR